MTDEHNKPPPQHTPGPWVAGIKDGDVERICAGGVCVAEVLPTDCTPEEFEANARLIAAAPDLLEALERVHILLDRISDTLHYEDGEPVTALDARDIEIIYGDSVTELAPVETLIRIVRGLP